MADTAEDGMANERYTSDQVKTAARELREAAGSEEERLDGTEIEGETFSAEEAITALREEIRLLHERGFTDEQIADLLTGFDIEVTAAQVERG
jgi:hypothetical protein